MENLLPASTTAQLLGNVTQLLADFKEVLFVLFGLMFAALVIDIVLGFFGVRKNEDTAPDQDTDIL